MGPQHALRAQMCSFCIAYMCTGAKNSFKMVLCVYILPYFINRKNELILLDVNRYVDDFPGTCPLLE